jgi:hypothetical protein
MEVQSITRICAATGRELQVGERYCAVLVEQEGKFVRKDYAASNWPGAPSNAIAYWSGKVQPSDRPQKPIINDEMLADCLSRLDGTDDISKVRFRYVVALLLMRRKRLKFEDSGRDVSGNDFLLLRDTKSGDRVRIVDPRLTDSEITDVQDEVFRMFGWTG